jgi:hypothetical protein
MLAKILASKIFKSIADFQKKVRLACSTQKALLQKDIWFKYNSRIFSFEYFFVI